MIKEIQAKTILSHAKTPDPWFGIQYTMNLYRGCQHQCIYCDSRSECYRISNFNETLVKTNALELLEMELPAKRVKGVVGTGSMNDPYAPVEKKYKLVRGALQLISKHGFGVHILTKSDLVLRDLDVLAELNHKKRVLVSFTITCAQDDLGKKIEPGAALVSKRLAAIRALRKAGIPAGVLLMPVLPFLEDDWENIRGVVERAAEHGAGYILAAFGMTQRKGQREYYLSQLDRLFPGVKEKHIGTFGNRYECQARNAGMLDYQFRSLCEQKGIATEIPKIRLYPPEMQMSLPIG